ncbi:MAG: cytochrome c-550 PedF [Rhodobacteraceae bacterium]|uniref:cytochrome c-550 PedF n=1 Tax=Amaricoccus sp. B4 TaxID=3368557 RepID=UPI000DAD34F5|nr:cytochrome c-550 PedF [Paracoccaceae bacterium]
MPAPRIITASLSLAAAGLIAATGLAFAHGDVTPQPVNTDALPDVGEEWLTENPYRDMGDDVWTTAVRIGGSAFNQNCARCHGLEAISGGLAPDLRFLEAEEYGDEWFAERFQFGYTQNGTTMMPAFGEILGQKAGWAIRTYIETRPDGDTLEEFYPELNEIRDQLMELAKADTPSPEAESIKEKLTEIASQIDTLSGAPVADSIAFRAAHQIGDTPASYHAAAETLTVGLPVAQ